MLPPLKAGEILRSRYRIVETVGRGGMGAIYKAEDMRLEGRFTAIKEIQIDPGASPESQEQSHYQFHREASTLARLDHPNLPKVSDFFEEGEREFLVMDFVPGRDLREIIEEARERGNFIPESQVLRWAEQICEAVAYLHGQDPPVLHRDIKPANIKLTPDGRIKLVDFGLVKLLVPDENRTITVVQGRGTAFYTPLEQYGGETGHTDTRSDIYALGATLYHLLTNTPPPPAKERFLNPSSLRPPREINPNISRRTQDAVLWALEMHPDNRPPDIITFREALLGTEPLGELGERQRENGRAHRNTGLAWPIGWWGRDNMVLALIAVGMLVAALLVTLFPLPVTPAAP